MKLSDSKYFNQILMSLLEKPKRKIDILSSIFPNKFTFKEKITHLKGELECSKCHSSFSTNKKLRRKKWGRPSKALPKCPECKILLSEKIRKEAIPKIKDKNFESGWEGNTRQFFRDLEKEKLINKVERKKPSNINFDMIIEGLIDRLLEKARPMMSFMDENEKGALKEELKKCIKNEILRKDLFGFEKWSFLLFDGEEFKPQFKTPLGFINVCFLTYLLSYRKKILKEELKSEKKYQLSLTRIEIFEEKLVDIIIENRLKGLDLLNYNILTNEYKKSKQIKQTIEDGFKKLTFEYDKKLIEALSKVYAAYFSFDANAPIAMISDKLFEYIEKNISVFSFRRIETLGDLFFYDIRGKVEYMFECDFPIY